MPEFRASCLLPATPREVFDWHARPGAFQRLGPPWQPMKIVQEPPHIRDGARAIIKVPMGPFWKTWVAEHRGYVEGEQFQDVQLSGPFKSWLHTHAMKPANGGCELIDRIEYALPLGFVSHLVAKGALTKQLRQLFHYRHTTTRWDLERHALCEKPMRVLVSGGRGLLGSTLLPFLRTGGHEVVSLTRGEPGDDEIRWDPSAGTIDRDAMRGFDAVVHLAGENVGAGRWNAAKKARILKSRVDGTRLLSETVAQLESPPAVFVSASAVGFYGDRGDEELTEDSAPGDNFLAGVCRAWEDAAAPARDAGLRTVNLRFGVILTPKGGALQRMLTPFKLGVGGRLASGTQYMPWIGIDDAVGAIHHALVNDVEGAVNAVGPELVTNRTFTKILGRVLRRPTLLPMPKTAARIAFGEAANDLLLSSARVQPSRLRAGGYAYQQPSLEGALRHVLGRVRL